MPPFKSMARCTQCRWSRKTWALKNQYLAEQHAKGFRHRVQITMPDGALIYVGPSPQVTDTPAL